MSEDWTSHARAVLRKIDARADNGELAINLARLMEGLHAGRSTAVFKRNELRERLDEIAAAARVIADAMKEPELLAALQIDQAPHLRGVLPYIPEIAQLAEKASGAVPAGPGRNRDVFGLDLRLCSAIIARETWQLMHGRYPSQKSGRAWEVANEIWIRTGGEEIGLSDPPTLTGWINSLRSATKYVGWYKGHVQHHLTTGDGTETTQ